MIIKSLSRKEASFGQLVRYIEAGADDDRQRLHHNLFVREPDAIIAAMKANAALLPKRKNGVMLYHEILSVTRASGISVAEQKALIREIVARYVGSRAPHCLAYGALHEDKANNLHYHLVISANAAGDKRRHRLSKGDFTRIQRDLERRVLEQYPELEQTRAIDKRASKTRTRRAEGLERRTGRRPQIDAVIHDVRYALDNAATHQELHRLLKDAGLSIYRRGKTIGVVSDSGRKHRLATLGLDAEFHSTLQRLEQRSMAHVERPADRQERPAQPIAERKPTEMDRAIEQTVETIDVALQLGADVIQGPEHRQTQPATPDEQRQRIAAERHQHMVEIREAQKQIQDVARTRNRIR